MIADGIIKSIFIDDGLETILTLLCLVWQKSCFTKKYLKWLYCKIPLNIFYIVIFTSINNLVLSHPNRVDI